MLCRGISYVHYYWIKKFYFCYFIVLDDEHKKPNTCSCYREFLSDCRYNSGSHGDIVLDLTTAGATGGRTRVDWGKEDPAIFGTRLGKARGLPRFSPPLGKEPTS